MQSQFAQLIAEISGYNNKIEDLTNKVEVLQTKIDDLTGDIVETDKIGQSPFWKNIRSLVMSDGIIAIGSSVFKR